MAAERGVEALEPVDARLHERRHGLAQPLIGIAARARGAPTQPERLGQLVDQRVALGRQALGTGEVPVAVGLVEVVFKVAQPLPVLGHRGLVERGLG
ncbi:MAG TPA: hypothetical protein VE623_02165 [Acidimicrobiales bacterium]|nr:hypothetical protein [Acidimicrobiales bacterium]